VRTNAGKRGFPNESFAKNYAKPGNEILKGTDFGWRSKSADHHSPGEGSFKDKPFSERYRSPANAKPGGRKGMEKDRWFGSSKFDKVPPRIGHGLSPPSPRERIKQFEIRYQPSQLVMATKNSSTHVYSRADLLKVYEAISKDGTLSMPPHANLEGIKATSPMAPYANRIDKESLMILAQLRPGSSPEGTQAVTDGAKQTKDTTLLVDDVGGMEQKNVSTAKPGVAEPEPEQSPILEAKEEGASADNNQPPTGIHASGGVGAEKACTDHPWKGAEIQQGPPDTQQQPQQSVAQQGWCYLDPQRQMQGPFTCEEILDWFEQGFFPPNLPVRPAHLPADTPFIPLVNAIPKFGPAGKAFLDNRQQGVFTQSQKQLLMHQKQQQHELLQRQIQLQQMQLQQQQASLPPVEGLPPSPGLLNGSQSMSPPGAPGLMLGVQGQGYGQQPEMSLTAAMGHPSADSLSASLHSINLSGAESRRPSAADVQPTAPLHPRSSAQGVQGSMGGRMLTLDEIESQQMQHASSTFVPQRQAATLQGPQAHAGAIEHGSAPRQAVRHSIPAPGAAVVQAPPPSLPGSVSSSPPRQTKQGWNVHQQDKPVAKSLAEIQQEEAENAARARAVLMEKQVLSSEAMAASLQTPWSQHSAKQVPALSMREIQLEEERKAKLASARTDGSGVHVAGGGNSPWASQMLGYHQPVRNLAEEEAKRTANNALGGGAQTAVTRSAGGRAVRAPAQSAWSMALGASAPSKSLKEIQEEETRRNAIQGSGGAPATTLAAKLGAQSAPKAQEDDDLLWDYSKKEQPTRPPPAILSNVQSGWNTQASLPKATKQPATPAPAMQTQPLAAGPTDTVQNEASAETTVGHPISANFRDWCKEQSLKLTGSDDMTLIDFLLGLQSSGEIAEYIQVYLGQSAAVSSFTAEFVRRKHAEEVRRPALEEDRAASGSAEPEGPTQDQAKNKKGKRSRGKKVNPSQLLGFSSGISYESVERGV